MPPPPMVYNNTVKQCTRKHTCENNYSVSSVLSETPNWEVTRAVLPRKKALENVVIEVEMILVGADTFGHEIGYKNLGIHGAATKVNPI